MAARAHPFDGVRLVTDGAVARALDEDERDWIEWKSDHDLTTKSTHGTIARHILGMANRQPDAAAPHIQGCGYIVGGTEPGSERGRRPLIRPCSAKAS